MVIDPVPSGLAELDRLSALLPGTVTVVCGEPGVGTSSFLTTVAGAALRAQVPVWMTSWESTPQAVYARLMAARTQVSLVKMRGGWLGDDDWAKVASAVGIVSRYPLTYADPATSVEELASQVRHWARDRHPDQALVVLDGASMLVNATTTDPAVLPAAHAHLSALLHDVVARTGVTVLLNVPSTRASQHPSALRAAVVGSEMYAHSADAVLEAHRERIDGGVTRLAAGELRMLKSRHGHTETIGAVLHEEWGRWADAPLAGAPPTLRSI